MEHTNLAHWQSTVCTLERVSAPIHRHRLVVFGENLVNTPVDVVLKTILAQGLKISAVVEFRPDSRLPSALSFALESPKEDINTQSKHLLRAAFSALELEVAVLFDAPQLTSPGLLVMDMDSTAIQIECIDEIARLANVYDEVAAVTKAAMLGQLAFSDSLKRRVAKLKGIDLSLLDTIRFELPLMPGVEQLCAVLKEHNWVLAIASGGFTLFAEQLRAPLNLDAIVANELDFDGTALSGTVNGEIIDAEVKRRTLLELKAKYSLSDSQTVAIGDGANDLLMMDVAALGVAIHGKPKVVEEADAAICKGSLLQMLYFLTTP
ncbi:Phosphoserine phosphatase [Pseudoalteromonas luteoviolacea B = ATCC 29581]|nr:Phosphoserine phosphatase [Pseudoalteromonas luteoviolacea B = ATCC 29581]